MNTITYGSTAFTKINNVYQNFPLYRLFRSHLLSKEAYAKEYSSFSSKAMQEGLSEDDCYLTARLCDNEQQWVNDAFASMQLKSIDYKEFLEARHFIYQKYYHANRTTYIFPEEEAFMYGYIKNRTPKDGLFLGSYYGYWAVWALFADIHLKMTLLDINQEVCDLASENFQRLGLINRVEIVCDDGERYLKAAQHKHDLLIIDAECPYDASVREEDRGKGIYHRLANAALPYLTGDVICHNILTKCDTNIPYLERKLPKNHQELKAFRSLMQESGFSEFEFQSTEGIGVYTKTKGENK